MYNPKNIFDNNDILQYWSEFYYQIFMEVLWKKSIKSVLFEIFVNNEHHIFFLVKDQAHNEGGREPS